MINNKSNTTRILLALKSKSNVSRTELLKELDMGPATFQYSISKLTKFINIERGSGKLGRKPHLYSLNKLGENCVRLLNIIDG